MIQVGETFFLATSHQMIRTRIRGSRLGMKVSMIFWTSNLLPPTKNTTGVDSLTKLTARAPMMKLPSTPAP
jgi:hypothetical protein